jgi:polyisoprenoid-binding protein YceI
MKYIKIILMVFLFLRTLADASEYIMNESVGWVKGSASTPTHEFPVVVTRFQVFVDSVDADNQRTLRVIIPVEGITTEHERRDEHMFSGVLLKDEFPRINYHTVSNLTEPREGPFTLEGVLTVQGISKPYTIQGVISQNGDNWIARSDFIILMSDFNLSRPGFGPMKVRDEIKMSLFIKSQIEK